MSNRLKMAKVHAIQHLHSLRWSQRRIAAELNIDRGTVARHLKSAAAGPNAAISPAGLDGSNAATFPGVPAPADEDADVVGGAGCPHETAVERVVVSLTSCGGDVSDSNAAISPAGSEVVSPQAPDAMSPPADPPRRVGRISDCEPYRELILAKLDQQLSAQRIFQDLASDHGFAGSYDSVKRFVRSLGQVRKLPFRRMECAPGQQAQVDFGKGAPIVGVDGKRRRTHLFRMVLSHSRKAYSEVTFRQTTEDFIRCLENALEHFGGVPQTLVIDNLKAAVKHPDWFDPELVPRLEAFCRHYGVVVLPTKPYMPRHKGKVERSVDYAQENGVKGHTFASLQAENEHLLRWETNVADRRIHGTTRQQVGKVFAEVERPTLQPLPRERFPFFHEAQRSVNRDGHVEVAKAYYSAPPEYLGRTVWVRWDARLVRIFSDRFEQIALHVRHEHGRFSTHHEHLAPEKISGLERGAAYLLRKVRLIGPQSHRWAEALLVARGIEGTRVLQGLLALTKKHPSETLENACETALSHGAFRLRVVRQLLARQAPKQESLPLLDEHPLIRPLDDYGRIVAAALDRRMEQQRAVEHSQPGFLRHDRANECREETSVAQSSTAQQKGPDNVRQGLRDIHPPRFGYPLSGCSSAEPDAVSPNESSVVPLPSSFQQECRYHE